MITKGEKLEKDLKTKKVYHFIDPEFEVNQLSREVYKKQDIEVHYPRGFEGGQKYVSIKKFTYKGFRGRLPVGVVKSQYYGYGFTKTLGPFARFVDDQYDFKEVVIEKGGPTVFDTEKKVLFLSETSLQKLQDSFSTIYAKNNAEVQVVLESITHDLFPKAIKKPEPKYIKNALSLSLATWGNSIDEFSEQDKEAISELFKALSSSTDFLSSDSLKNTKQTVDVRLIEKALAEFDELYSKSSETPTLEKKWQNYLRENSWLFSSIFSEPVILFQDEAYAGGKAIDNTGGKYTDFLIKNSLSENVAFFEIKTHITSILEAKPYRGKNVFSTTKAMAGSVNQVLNQRDEFQKSFSLLKLKSSEDFESINPECFVLIGSLESLNNDQRYSFELFRRNNKDVRIITFDEIRKKIEILKSLIVG